MIGTWHRSCGTGWRKPFSCSKSRIEAIAERGGEGEEEERVQVLVHSLDCTLSNRFIPHSMQGMNDPQTNKSSFPAWLSAARFFLSGIKFTKEWFLGKSKTKLNTKGLSSQEEKGGCSTSQTQKGKKKNRRREGRNWSSPEKLPGTQVWEISPFKHNPKTCSHDFWTFGIWGRRK